MTTSKIRSPLRYQKVQRVISPFVRGTRLGTNRQRIEGKQYLDVGCGFNVHEQFINLDHHWHPDLDLCWDITKGIPLPSGSLQGIFSEHCLEHITLDQMGNVLLEFYRLLAPGGTVRIVLPDGELYVKTYLERNQGSSDKQFPYEYQDSYQDLYTPIMSLNRIFYKWGHRFIYDFRTVNTLLERRGFHDIRRESYLSGRDPALLNDSDWRADESLYIEAGKPQIEP